MILNMHIRKDWDRWYIPPFSLDDRAWTLCGKKSMSHTVGIPMISPQPVGATVSGDEFSWCLECCDSMLKSMTFVVEHTNLHPRVKHLYLEAMRECARQLIIATSITGRKDLTIE